MRPNELVLMNMRQLGFLRQPNLRAVDEGELYEIESKWRSLPTKFMNDEDYEHEKVYFHPDSETEFYTEESLPQLILHELMNI
ncbi:hypothetical protein [Psychrobacter sp. ASPA161_6]|uniref:hypothetical protein n=1 Tax=Psychrobacter sp. ASPA161_6 TaxID=3160962 RepID=UPI003F7F4158